MAAILREFVDTSQQIVNIKHYAIDADTYATSPSQIEFHPCFKKLLDPQLSIIQYSSIGLVSDILFQRRGLNFQKSLRKQIPPLAKTPVVWVDTVS